MSSLIRLIYVSTATSAVSAVILDVVRAAERRNFEMGVSGMLVFGCGGYLQMIEGGEAQVSGLFSDICADHRHRVNWVTKRPIRSRLIESGLPMGYHELSKCPQLKGLTKSSADRAAAELARLARELYPNASSTQLTDMTMAN